MRTALFAMFVLLASPPNSICITPGVYVAETSNWRVQKLILHRKAS